MSRLVVVLLALSATLVAARWTKDRLPSRRLGGWVFWGILAAGTLLLAPFVLRSGYLLAADRAVHMRRWSAAAERYGAYVGAGGRADRRIAGSWILALMGSSRWSEARSLLVAQLDGSGAQDSPERRAFVLSLGICDFYLGRSAESESEIRSAEAQPGGGAVRSYFLARLAERRSDLPAARSLYADVLEESPSFYPALYHLVRVARTDAEKAIARERLDRFEREAGAAAGAAPLRAALEGGNGSLGDKEFVLVPH